MEYEKCYVFQPEDSRPAKRRKTALQGLQASWDSRKKAFKEAWAVQRSHIHKRLSAINANTVTEVIDFLDGAASSATAPGIPTGLILTGPNSALRTSIASQATSEKQGGLRRIFVPISTGSGANLKALLKTIIQKATSRSVNEDEDELEDPSGSRKGPRLLNYDLQALHDHVKERRVQQVVIAIEDTEAFDSDLLSELIVLLGCWKDRVPFACLFTIATSVEFLQQRLSRASIQCLDGKLFDAAVSADEVEQVFEAITSPDSTLWLGPGLMSLLLERQTDYIQSIDSFVEAAHYAYMSCFYANALSIFLKPDLTLQDVPRDHFEALRNLPSFQMYTRHLLDEGEVDRLRNLLDSDEDIFEFARQSVASGRQAVLDAVLATELIRTVQSCIPSTAMSTKPQLYVQALSGNLIGAPAIRSLLLMLRKSPSNVTLDVIRRIERLQAAEDIQAHTLKLVQELEQLVAAQEESDQPLRSEDDVQNSTFRTTVIAQKVELSKQKSTLSKQDAAYTQIVRRFSDLLEAFLKQKLIRPRELPLHEIFVYDLKSPYTQVFMPRPRHAIERALASPHDYLDCDCCETDQERLDETSLASSQPATAVLYQLYLESGNLINASDLWQAFHAVLGDSQKDEEQTMALFQRALAELRYLGLVKGTRKRVDHIAKVAWRGL